ncbi:MAG: aconitase family protein [Desulfobacterales bacterium]
MSGTGPGAAYKRFFDIGRNGVCHAIFPEKGFVRPGYTIIMGDSHTCTHGAFGAFAAGVGTTDLEVGILKGVCAFQYPKTIKIEVTGTPPARRVCQGCDSVGYRPAGGERRHQQGDGICRTGD